MSEPTGATPPTRQEALAYFEELSTYLFEMRFGAPDRAALPTLPPALPNSRVFIEARHYVNCTCPLCMEARYGAAGL